MRRASRAGGLPDGDPHAVISHLAAGDSVETVLQEFPRIEKADIEASLEYAAFLCTEKAVAG